MARYNASGGNGNDMEVDPNSGGYIVKGSSLSENVPVRRGEVAKQMEALRQQAMDMQKLSEELVNELASILSPANNGDDMKETTDSSLATPLASNLRDIQRDFAKAAKTLRFVLNGIEL